MPVTRRLAAIVIADVVGYSRLMERDEAGTHARLRELRGHLFDPKVAAHGGRIVHMAGDGILLEFPSTTAALRCAVEVQREMGARDLLRKPDERIALRVGINLGDIIVDGDNIAGDGVNVAARLETLAKPGGICVTAAVREQVHEDLGVEFIDAGEHQVKNISRAIRVYHVALDKEAVGKTQAAPITAEAPPSIAVLPFVNRSHDQEDEYFSDGLADELLNVLAKIRGLHVAARSSVFTFKGKNATIAEVGRALNVATVLEGSVRKAGNRLRISVQLVKVSDGYHLWSESYDRTLEDIFAVQDNIAQSVVKELRTTLLGEATDATAEKAATEAVAAAAKGRAENPEAYRLYLQGRFEVDRVTRLGVERGIELTRQALALDPTFARGWAGLSRAYNYLAGFGWIEPREGFELARHAALRSLELAPDLVEGHLALGYVFTSYDWNWAAADVEFGRAFALAPDNPDVLRARASLAGEVGRLDEAIAFARRAMSLDPLSVVAKNHYARLCSCAGRHAEAVEALNAAIELDPHAGENHHTLSRALLLQGKAEEALAEAEREVAPIARSFATALAQHALSRPDASEAALSWLIDQDAAYSIARVYAYREQVDRAFEWLERAYNHRDPGIVNVATEPLLTTLRSDSRWRPLLRKLGLDHSPTM